MDHGPHRSTLQDCINPIYDFSGDDLPGRYTLLSPDILTTFDVPDYQILCHNSLVIPATAAFRLRVLTFFWLKRRYFAFGQPFRFNCFLLSISNNTCASRPIMTLMLSAFSIGYQEARVISHF
jgi:hypothetical protein